MSLTPLMMAAIIGSLKKAEEKLSQLNREVISLKEQLEKADEESKKHENLQKASEQNQILVAHLKDENNNRQARIEELAIENGSLKEQLSRSHADSEALKRELANQMALILALEEEVVQLKNDSQNAEKLQAERDVLQRRLEESEEKNLLLRNLTEAGNKPVPPSPAQGTGALISAAIQGDLGALRRHINQAGQQDATGMTALMHAALHGHTRAVRLLRPLEARLQDGKGQTALMHAVSGGHGDCVRLLLLERDLADATSELPEDIATRVYEEVDGKRKEGYKNVALSLLETRPQLPVLPEELSSYQITGRLGKGGFGTIFSAYGNGQNVAVKVVSLGGRSDEVQGKLRGEAKTLTSLKHPNVLRCLGVGENDLEKTYMFVTEMCCGDLRGEIRRREKARSSYSDREVWRIIRDVAAALTFIHEKRVAHRDLKPENVFLTPSGHCVLGDFGLAKVLGDSPWMSTFVGTKPYMAPEIHRNEKYNKSVDIWALGVMAYELCTGRFPFFDTIAIIQKDPPAIEGRDQELADIIHRMLSKDPKNRPTAREVLEEAKKTVDLVILWCPVDPRDQAGDVQRGPEAVLLLGSPGGEHRTRLK